MERNAFWAALDESIDHAEQADFELGRTKEYASEELRSVLDEKFS